MITAHFTGDKITSTSESAFSLYEKSRLGEKKEKKVEYSGVETLYLINQNKLELFSNAKKLDEETLLKKLKRKDKKIETKLAVFSNLRKKGYIVKTALKFGAEFRVYDKGVKPGQDHAKWLVISAKESEQMNWHDFAARSRVAHSTKKNVLFGVVDDEDDVTYYEVGWVKV